MLETEAAVDDLHPQPRPVRAGRDEAHLAREKADAHRRARRGASCGELERRVVSAIAEIERVVAGHDLGAAGERPSGRAGLEAAVRDLRVAREVGPGAERLGRRVGTGETEPGVARGGAERERRGQRDERQGPMTRTRRADRLPTTDVSLSCRNWSTAGLSLGLRGGGASPRGGIRHPSCECRCRIRDARRARRRAAARRGSIARSRPAGRGRGAARARGSAGSRRASAARGARPRRRVSRHRCPARAVRADGAVAVARRGRCARASRTGSSRGSSSSRRAGSLVPTELLLVPMLFVLPLGWVPLAVAAAYVGGSVVDAARGRSTRSASRSASSTRGMPSGPCSSSRWRRESDPSWSDWPIYLAALLAQYVFEFASCAAWERFVNGLSPLVLSASWLRSQLADAALAPGRARDRVRRPGRAARRCCSRCRSSALLERVRARAARAHRPRARALARLPRHRVPARRRRRGRRRVHRPAQPRTSSSSCSRVADELGLDARERRHAELAALLHDVGKIRIPTEIINKPGALTPRSAR